MDKSTSRFDSAQRSKISKAVMIQEAARKSLTKLLRPLSAFVFDCGLSMSEANFLLRTVAVQSAAVRQLETNKRANISGIAAITGIPRGEVSRILKSSGTTSMKAIRGRQNITSRILSAWYSDPEYLTANRRPRDLKLFGSGKTFESLVRTYGQGIPTRAILDELKRARAIQLLTSTQMIFPKMPLAINPRITYRKIRDLDAAAADLFLRTLSPRDVSFVKQLSKVWSGPVPQVRRRFEANAAALLRELQSKLKVQQAKHGPKSEKTLALLSVKFVYKETNLPLAKQPLQNRRNLDRNR